MEEVATLSPPLPGRGGGEGTYLSTYLYLLTYCYNWPLKHNRSKKINTRLNTCSKHQYHFGQERDEMKTYQLWFASDFSNYSSLYNYMQDPQKKFAPIMLNIFIRLVSSCEKQLTIETSGYYYSHQLQNEILNVKQL